MIKDYVEVSDHQSLDDIIAQLEKLRDALPAGADAKVKLRGDDVFGRHLCVAFLRPLSDAEADCDRRYGRPVRLRRAA
jgi:hypothetical protein